MKLSVIGCGYLGAVHAASMTSLGHEVIGIDVDPLKIEALAAGRAPFFEPGLPELLTAATATGRLRFSTDPAAAAEARVHFIAVGTPQLSDAPGADLAYVNAAVDGLLPLLGPGHLVVGKSTVPVGTAEALAERIRATGAELAWNPEFLREGFAVQDTLHPDRIVYGFASELITRDAGEVSAPGREILDKIYAEAIAEGAPVVVTDFATAELVKVAANAFLATKISFINAMAEIADATGADVSDLADAIGHDNRIGRRFLNAGLGFGGGCLPKDIRAFGARAEELGLGDSLGFLREVDQINLRRREHVVDLAAELLGGDVRGRRIAVLGLSFKPQSDDVRDSPSLDVAMRLHERGANVIATDPQAIKNAQLRAPGLPCDALENAVEGAELVILGTEWTEYRELDPRALGARVATPRIIDARNVLDPAAWSGAGWEYRGMGRR
ncbi:UDP-glucose dehydrogenase family protein [Mycetocola spongiae]|uniref:UDP-glucose dehydrogenase family protein n=1 Tax=Mycetocola spongiae TaxID=2859226 RepID=UPI001CF41336|nr:UDP-glucose/GDP-mannose dehydrogenase family protein [Mycetocola spongiae]UCR87865.1 UDP-glucose/GDP-mannose dehydrogenase family protein [Mycetocola spongiae]